MKEPMNIPRISTQRTGHLPDGETSPCIIYAKQAQIKWHLKRSGLPPFQLQQCIAVLEQQIKTPQLLHLHELLEKGKLKIIIRKLTPKRHLCNNSSD